MGEDGPMISRDIWGLRENMKFKNYFIPKIHLISQWNLKTVIRYNYLCY